MRLRRRTIRKELRVRVTIPTTLVTAIATMAPVESASESSDGVGVGGIVGPNEVVVVGKVYVQLVVVE